MAHVFRLSAARRTIGMRRARGFAVAIMLVVLVLGSLYAVMMGLNTATAEIRQRQEETTLAAMRQAKDGLIAWSATRVAGAGPGHLPCPDDDDDGQSDTVTCGNASTRIGRLPWKTLGLPDLRDSSGERLWYAVSRCFLERTTDVYCQGEAGKSYAVNSDTPGQIVISGGLSPATGIAAVIFAPGTATARTAGGDQVRSGANRNDATHYLEGENANNPAAACEQIGAAHPVTGKLACVDTFETRRRCEDTSCAGGAFNDQLILVRSQELFQVVENVVAKRIENEVAPALRYYRDQYDALPSSEGFFPFAAPFNPGQPVDQFCGVSGEARGLLPVSAAASCISWSTLTVSDLGGGNGSIDSWSCTASPAGQPDNVRMTALTCTITYTACPGSCFGPDTPEIRIRATLDNAAMSLAIPAEQTKIAFGNSAGTYTGGSSWGGPSLSHSLTGAGNLRITYEGFPPDFGPGTRTVTITIPIYSAPTRYKQVNPATPDTAWFFENEWYRVTYYAVASSRLYPPSSSSCTVGTSCLSVNTYPATFVSRSALVNPGPPNNKDVVLVLGGHLLPALAATGVSRPSVTPVIADYLEGENLSSVDRVFEQRPRSPAFNDKVIVIAP